MGPSAAHGPAFGASVQPRTPVRDPAQPPARLTLTVPDASPSLPPSSVPTTPRTAGGGGATEPLTALDTDDDATPAASPHPLSAFYSHPTTRTSLEQLHTTSTATLHRPSPSRGGGGGGGPADDLPPLPGNAYAAAPAHGAKGSEPKAYLMVHGAELSRDPSANSSGADVEKGAAVWPSPCHVAQRRASKATRRCHPLQRLSPRNRFVAKLLLALLLVGVATGLGVGISKAAGVGVWKNTNSQTAIGE